MSGEARPSRRSGLARAAGWPLRRALDPRVQWAANLVDDRLAARLDDHDRRLEEVVLALRELRDAVGALHEHEVAVETRVDANERRLLALMGSLHARLAGAPEALELLGDDIAAFLNWSAGPEGYAAQSGLWFNPPVPVEHAGGSVRPLLVNERIVEQPFLFGALHGLPAGARILDVGGSESTIGLSLATLGHEVTVVDPRGLALEHPGLRALALRLDQLDPADGSYDAAVAISAVEHFGLESYGATSGAGRPGQAGDGREDLAALRALRRLVRPGGLLVLSVPIGAPAVDGFQRVYDADGVRELLEGWSIRELSAAWRRDRMTWISGAIDEPAGDAGVALAVAVNEAGAA